jgi:hypothetical protein
MHENEANLRSAQDIVWSIFARQRASSAFLQADRTAVSGSAGMALGHHQLLAAIWDSSSSIASFVRHSFHLGRTRGFQTMEETLTMTPNKIR